MKTDYKFQLLESIFRSSPAGSRVIDLGSGNSQNFVEILQMFPSVSYVGVEINGDSRRAAQRLVGHLPNVSIVESFGEMLNSSLFESFDICLSLSVLEHVKNLADFLRTSARLVKTGGQIIHRYDLGHALYPSSLRERARVLLCRKLPFLASARHFTTHPDLAEIRKVLADSGVTIDRIEQSQIYGLKQIMNRLDWTKPDSEKLARDIVALESRIFSETKDALSPEILDLCFPTITIWGRKVGSSS